MMTSARYNAEKTEVHNTRLRLASYNIQTGSTTKKFHQYFTHSWKHVLPHAERMENLGNIAKMLSQFDFVGLQEVDAGSLRSGFINQTEYIAERGGFPHWNYQTNRRLGKIAQHSNGFISKHKPVEIIDHKLPGVIPGRGALFARFGHGDDTLLIGIVHLALGRGTRMKQLENIADIVNDHDHAIIMGDMNCRGDSPEIRNLLKKSHLCEPLFEQHTFPSWRPERDIDHILVSDDLHVEKTRVLEHAWSDHLPITMDILIPDSVLLSED